MAPDQTQQDKEAEGGHRMSDAERELLAFVRKHEMALRWGLADTALKWAREAERNRNAYEAGEADPAIAAAQDAEKAMSHEQYRRNAEACQRHCQNASETARQLFRLIGMVEAQERT